MSVRAAAVTTAGRGILFLCALCASHRASAQDATARNFEERLEALERRVEQAEDAAMQTEVRVTANEQGFRIRSADQRYELRIRGTFQVDYRAFADDETPAASTTVPRTAATPMRAMPIITRSGRGGCSSSRSAKRPAS